MEWFGFSVGFVSATALCAIIGAGACFYTLYMVRTDEWDERGD